MNSSLILMNKTIIYRVGHMFLPPFEAQRLSKWVKIYVPPFILLFKNNICPSTKSFSIILLQRGLAIVKLLVIKVVTWLCDMKITQTSKDQQHDLMIITCGMVGFFLNCVMRKVIFMFCKSITVIIAVEFYAEAVDVQYNHIFTSISSKDI